MATLPMTHMGRPYLCSCLPVVPFPHPYMNLAQMQSLMLITRFETVIGQSPETWYPDAMAAFTWVCLATHSTCDEFLPQVLKNLIPCLV